MHRIFFLLFVFILFITSCNNNKGKSTTLLPHDTIVQIIADMHLADAILISPKVQQIPKKITSQKFYNTVLAKHNINNKIFEENLNSLSNDTLEFKLVYNDVIMLLSIMQDNIMSQDSTAKK